ncbi:hypothetical protein GJAV_G00105490 [Gymnothorax javanicus]|nr:hypothetical protein GJAV_G00105490 [Gymnothorax javanicus]
MENERAAPPVMDEWEARTTETQPTSLGGQSDGSRAGQWTNGKRILVISSRSLLCPSFDLSLCRAPLEADGLQVPQEDFETPLRTALDSASVRRYLFFNSAMFHFLLGPRYPVPHVQHTMRVMYVVVWSGLFTTVHAYLSLLVSPWVLCLSVTLVSLLLTVVIILVLTHTNKKININVDVRLIQVNERLFRHNLLVGMADWVQQCTGRLKLFCVYWDLTQCQRSLAVALEEMSLTRDKTQAKLHKNMSYLNLVTDVTTFDPEQGSLGLEECEEERPLLMNNDSAQCNSRTGQRGQKLTKDYSLVPSCDLSVQATAHQLLLTYSATYMRLLASEKLPRGLQHPLESGMSHCTVAPLCLCQYVLRTALR